MIFATSFIFFLFSILLLAAAILGEKISKGTDFGWVGLIGTILFGFTLAIMFGCVIVKIILWSMVHMP